MIVSRYIHYIKLIAFYSMLGIVVIIFFFNQVLALLTATVVLAIYFLSYIFTISFKKNLIRSLRQYSIINDYEISKKLKLPVDTVREILFSMAKNQKRKKYLIVLINKRYVFYNKETIDNFKKLYNKGYSEKQILEALQRKVRLRSRAEVKAIEQALSRQKRLVSQKQLVSRV